MGPGGSSSGNTSDYGSRAPEVFPSGCRGFKTCVSVCLSAAAKSAITFDHFDISAQFFWVKLTPSK